jgi:hypothetical protein
VETGPVGIFVETRPDLVLLALQELAHEPEAEPALELAAPGARRRQTGVSGQCPRLSQQSALADPSWPLDEEQRPYAARRARDQLAQDGELALALQQNPELGGLSVPAAWPSPPPVVVMPGTYSPGDKGWRAPRGLPSSPGASRAGVNVGSGP